MVYGFHKIFQTRDPRVKAQLVLQSHSVVMVLLVKGIVLYNLYFAILASMCIAGGHTLVPRGMVGLKSIKGISLIFSYF